ncbi:hypothetical protein F0562_007038 [Nyssa sinensis]|uniref:Non-specific serine/threonine protein kinase n=1 Tax=Nyssa sinensis TaxID=561372 RepID=A0A5J5A590_9ASTE|nr:hypothetical protein F0562_007038 [Nyssa sinensis]
MATRAGGSLNPISFLIFAFLCYHELTSLAAGASTIGIGGELNYSSNPLVSPGGNFTLGYFTLSNTNYSYFGIWYTNDEQARKVWVVNPNTPLLDNSGVLTIDGRGILKITSGGNTILNISDQVGTGNVNATLDDSGNFVLMDETQRRLWESFDHPTNTLLPGMKLGQNLTAGQNWSLTSWLSDYVAASGAFTLSWEPSQESGQLVIYRRGEVYWNSGLLIDQKFHFLPQLNADSSSYRYTISYVSNNDERFITFDAAHENLPMWFLNPEGQIIDGGNMFISPIDFCYGYQSDNGCANSLVPNCRGHNDRFEQRRGYFVGNSGRSYDDNSSLSLSDCMERCWNNCTCLGFTNNSNGTGCIIWSGNLEYREDNPNNMIINVLVRGNSPKGNKWWMCRREGEQKKLLHELTASDSFNNVNEIENGGREGHDLKIFSFASIVAATNDFSNENKLGQGGFGPVYKGRLAGGSVNLISFLIFAFLCIWGLDSSLVAGANTIRIGDELNSSSNPLVSPGGNFTLGFFTLDYTKYSYFGIWYTNDDYLARKVWVANPNTPLLNNSGVLTIDSSGVLKITSGGSTLLNISDQVATGNVTATLLDSGNFVLMDQTEKRILWQSFDHPTDTLLPGMKLGQNLRTGKNWSLTSWLSNYVAASGAFTLSWEPTQESGQLVVYRRGEVYWKSGVLRNQSFEFMPALNAGFSLYSYNLRYIYNNDERSFTFSPHIDQSFMFLYDPTQNLPMWFLNPEGQIRDGGNQGLCISPADFCYGYQSDTGCADSVVPEPHCRGHNDSFKRRRRYFTNNTGSNDFNSSLSLSDCMERCWNDCNCVAFINNSNGTGCTIWSGNLEPRDDNPNAGIIYSHDSGNSSNTGNSSKENRRWIWLIIAVAISLLVLFLGLFCYLRIKKHRTEGEEEKTAT